MEVSGPPLGGLRAPKGTPKSLQGRGQYEASDLKLTQTKASELKLHSLFPQGHWSSRAEAELAKRTKIKTIPPDPAQNSGFLRKTIVRTLPRDPLGRGGPGKIKRRPEIQLGPT